MYYVNWDTALGVSEPARGSDPLKLQRVWKISRAVQAIPNLGRILFPGQDEVGLGFATSVST